MGPHTGNYDMGQPPPAVPHPSNPAVSSALPNPDQQYVDAFNAHMGEMRQAIDNSLASGIQQVGARRDAAAKVVAGLPAQFAAHYKNAKVDAGSMAKVMGGTVGGRRAIGGNANDTLAATMLSGGNAAANSTIPVLNLANQASYGQGVDTLNAAHLTAIENLGSQQASFDASQAASASSLAGQEAMWTTEHQAVDAQGHPMFGSSGKPLMQPSVASGTPTTEQLNGQAQSAGYTTAQNRASTSTAVDAAVKSGDFKTVLGTYGSGYAVDGGWSVMTPAQRSAYTNAVTSSFPKSIGTGQISDYIQGLVDAGIISGTAFHRTTKTG